MQSIQHTEAGGIYEEILLKLGELRRKENQERLLAGTLFFLLGFLGIFVLALVAETLLRFGVPGRTILFWCVAVASAIGFGWLIGIPLMRLLHLLKSSDDETLARKAGGHFPNIKDRLLNLLQLHREKEEGTTLYSPGLIDEAFLDLRSDIAGLDFKDAMTYRRARQLGKWLGIAAVALALITLSLPSSLFEAAGRLAHYRQDFAVPSPIRFVIQPGDAEAVRGENVHFLIAVEGMPLDNI